MSDADCYARCCLTAQSDWDAGIPEDLLVSQVQALSPQQAKAMLTIMLQHGILHRQAVTRPARECVPSIFGSALPEESEVSLHMPGHTFHGFCVAQCICLISPTSAKQLCMSLLGNSVWHTVLSA